MTQPPFLPGLELARLFYTEAVEPLLLRAFPDLVYSAALIGPGSEVLGFDTPMSADHHWGPRVMLYLRPEDLETRASAIREHLEQSLPPVFRGWSTSFSVPDADDNGVQCLETATAGHVRHRVELFTVDGWFRGYLGIPVDRQPSAAHWLSLPSQKLRSIVAGAVFRDSLGLEAIRERLSWYPRDVWLYLLGSGWSRIGQEEPLAGRAGHAGDEMGSAIIGARLVRDVMRLTFLLERVYAPYAKWLGAAFGRLTNAPRLAGHLERALHAATWQVRQSGLARAFEVLARIQHETGIGPQEPPLAGPFWERPFEVIHGDRIADAVFSEIRDPHVRVLATTRPIGGVDLVTDNTDVLESVSLQPRIAGLYEEER